MSLPWPPCVSCHQTELATAEISGRRLCERCLVRLVGDLRAFRYGLHRGEYRDGWNLRRCRRIVGDEDENDNPWSAVAVRALEDAPAVME